MANGSSINIEASLAAAVRNYLVAEPDDRISEDENLRPVCQYLSRLLGDLLKKADGWSQYAWVDDILPCTAERVSPNDVELTGLVVWLGGSKSGERKDPMFVAIHLSADFSRISDMNCTLEIPTAV